MSSLNKSINELNLPDSLNEKLHEKNIKTLINLFAFIQKTKANSDYSDDDLSKDEVSSLEKILKEYLESQKATPRKNPPALIAKNKPVTNSYDRILGHELLKKEEHYSFLLRKVELVGEIPFTRDDLLELANLLRQVFHKHPLKTALTAIEKGAPKSLIVYLVGQGVHGYREGDYWTSVSESLGVESKNEFGHVFESIIHRNKLAIFKELQEKSARYVSLILAHGGIPVYSLDDYFSNIVLPSISRPQYVGLDSEEVLDELLSSSAVLITDKPVIHFLEYGGRVALDIFNRSRRLLTQWQSGQPISTPEEIGLPYHIVEHFADWAKTKIVASSSSPMRTSKNRLKRPEFCMDPWGLGVFFRLPSQPVPMMDVSDCSWNILSGNGSQSIPVEVEVQGNTREITLRMDLAVNSYQVQFFQGDKTHEWRFEAGNSIYFFDPTQGTLLSRLSNNEVWILYPNQYELKILKGDGYQTEELPSLPGKWFVFKAEGWDLSDVQKLAFLHKGETVAEYDIRQQDHLSHPFLIGGRQFHGNLEDPAQLYIGNPAAIRIPINQEIEVSEQLGRWRLLIKPVGISDPAPPLQIMVSDLPEAALLVSETYVDILLDHEFLLGARPAGEFQVTMLGPLGLDTNFKIACWPELHVAGIQELYLPDQMGAHPVEVNLQTGLLDRIESTTLQSVIKTLNPKPGEFSITVPAGISRVNLQLVRGDLDGQVSIPLEFRLCRLRWRLVTQDVVETWSDNLIEAGIDLFNMLKSPLLIVSLPGIKVGMVDLYLRLLDLHSQEILVIHPAKRSKNYSGDFWRFDLDVLQSNLRENNSPILRLELVARGIPQQDVVQLPVVSFTRSINVRNISIDLKKESDKQLLDLHWVEPSPLQNRYVYIWSLWRLWQPAVRIEIPDHVDGHFTSELDRVVLSGGDYRLVFVVEDPWVNTSPPATPPAFGTTGAYDFEILKDERIAFLKWHARSFEDHLELVMSSAFEVLTSETSQEISWCLINLKYATGRQAMTFIHHLETLEQPIYLENLGEVLVSPDILRMLLREIESATITKKELSTILRYAPDIKDWQEQSLLILMDLEDRKWRVEVIKGLLHRQPVSAAQAALSAAKIGMLDMENVVELLFENRPQIIEALTTHHFNDGIATKIIEFLKLYNPFSGLPMIRVGTWVHVNAGWGKIDSIQDLNLHTTVDGFLENEGVFRLTVRLHIEIDPKLEGERVVIDMREKTITFPYAKKTYECAYCREFISSNLDMYKTHIGLAHPGKFTTPASSKKSFNCTLLDFSHSKQSTEESHANFASNRDI